jgi:hypothetical protein
MNTPLDELVGKKIKQIFVNQYYLRFVTDDGTFGFTVEGDCCSNSVFYDFIGVKKLLINGPVISVKAIELHPDEEKDKNGTHECISVYGFELVTEHPDFGPMTSVLSFRNYSNGYYGGWMIERDTDQELPELLDDTTHIS